MGHYDKPPSSATHHSAQPGRLRRLLCEPLLHFAVLGALLFAAATAWNARDDAHLIRVDAALSRQLAERYQRQFGRAPSAVQLQFLLEQHIADEIRYREGQALQLGRDDEVIRRRLIQKYRFLSEDVSVGAVPTEAQLQAYFVQHAAEYQVPEKFSFTHRYFNPDRDGDSGARDRAARVLDRLRAGTPAPAEWHDDAFSGQRDYAALSAQEIVQTFGDSALAAALPQIPLDQWSEPLRSGLGWHLVRVHARAPARLPALDEVRTQVAADYDEHQRQQRSAATFAELQKKYRVVTADATHDR